MCVLLRFNQCIYAHTQKCIDSKKTNINTIETKKNWLGKKAFYLNNSLFFLLFEFELKLLAILEKGKKL